MAAGCSERGKANGIEVCINLENWICSLPMTPTQMQAFDSGVCGNGLKGKDNASSVTGAEWNESYFRSAIHDTVW